jgi:hypothetical protein
MSLTKLSLGGNYEVTYKLLLPTESLVSDIPAGEGNIEKLFLRCSPRVKISKIILIGFVCLCQLMKLTVWGMLGPIR